MRKPFDGEYPVSQEFGNKLILNGIDVYAQYGLNGHNGLDFACPSLTPLYSPINGTATEISYDVNGYGNYVKIENEKEGVLLAHLDNVKVQVGFIIKEGDLVGISDNTGKSTGPHLHFGYFTKPRDRSNGYNGYIDPRPFLFPVVTPKQMEYTFLHKIGDVIEPTIDIPVGKSPGAENLSYGKIGIKFPAKIIGMSYLNETPYYNIDQSMIGGGTGYANAINIDTGEQYVAPVEPVKPVVDTITISMEEYKMLQKKSDDLTERNNTFAKFEALGYANPDAITKLKEEQNGIIQGLTKQVAQVLDRNAILLKMLQGKEIEDSTAIEEGIKAVRELEEAKDHILKIANATGSKPNLFDIVTHIFNFKDAAAKAIEKGKKEVEKGSKAPLTPETPQGTVQAVITPLKKEQVSYGVDWLMSFFSLKGGAK